MEGQACFSYLVIVSPSARQGRQAALPAPEPLERLPAHLSVSVCSQPSARDGRHSLCGLNTASDGGHPTGGGYLNSWLVPQPHSSNGALHPDLCTTSFDRSRMLGPTASLGGTDVPLSSASLAPLPAPSPPAPAPWHSPLD